MQEGEGLGQPMSLDGSIAHLRLQPQMAYVAYQLIVVGIYPQDSNNWLLIFSLRKMF